MTQSNGFDDLEDMLAGLLDEGGDAALAKLQDEAADERPPDIVAEEQAEGEVYKDMTTRAAPPAEEDDLDALARIMRGEDGPEHPDGPESEGFAPGYEERSGAAPETPVDDEDPEAVLRRLMSEESGGPEALSQAEGELNGTAADVAAELSGAPPSVAQGPQIHIPTFTDDEIADAIDIRNFGTLVTLQTRRWHAKVKDRQASKDAATASGADSEAFDTRKRLLVGADEKLKRIHKAIDQARAKHYDMTLPWSTVAATDEGKRTGARLLPNTLFMEYTTAMAHAKQEMKQALADFIPAYPGLVQLAQTKLGSRFNATEYPHSSTIANHFDLSFDFMPIPLGDDFKGLAQAQVDKLSDALKRKSNMMLENAMQDAWVRLREIVEHACERLNKPDGLFHYTMIENLRSQAKLLKHLNITSDQRIEDVRFFIEKNLCMHDVDAIRKDEHLRKQLGKAAKAALEMMEEAK